MFQGYWAAVVTPFRHDRIDVAAFERCVAMLAEAGLEGIVVGGSTGEALSLTREERLQLIKAATHTAEGRIHVAAGIIAATTHEAVQQAKDADKSGAAALLVASPFYVKPSSEGLYEHFCAVHGASPLPIIVYNNPGRTGVDIDLNTLERLTQLPRIAALKESSSHLLRIFSWRKHLRSDFALLSGDDGVSPAFLAMGGDGVISVTANVVPKLCVGLYNAWINADLETFAYIRDQLASVHEALFIAPNPCPVKYALSIIGLIRDEVRSPLLPLSDLEQLAIRRVLQDLSLLAA
ncbi:MAG: 4-hydroxy-tetrahydrodipicolinate synthase [Holosporales bacterium]|jgi:4-hydroxy-tetrahydrodipicolinate synthase|nr:4-hydroxy-tetrahydrodipicolinate synthase [Holosporales bacterium]